MRITLEVRETNLPAQLFFSKQGFRAVKVLRAVQHSFDAAGVRPHHPAGLLRVVRHGHLGPHLQRGPDRALRVVGLPHAAAAR